LDELCAACPRVVRWLLPVVAPKTSSSTAQCATWSTTHAASVAPICPCGRDDRESGNGADRRWASGRGVADRRERSVRLMRTTSPRPLPPSSDSERPRPRTVQPRLGLLRVAPRRRSAAGQRGYAEDESDEGDNGSSTASQFLTGQDMTSRGRGGWWCERNFSA
jgi:hypothetical protein